MAAGDRHGKSSSVKQKQENCCGQSSEAGCSIIRIEPSRLGYRSKGSSGFPGVRAKTAHYGKTGNCLALVIQVLKVPPSGGMPQWSAGGRTRADGGLRAGGLSISLHPERVCSSPMCSTNEDSSRGTAASRWVTACIDGPSPGHSRCSAFRVMLCLPPSRRRRLSKWSVSEKSRVCHITRRHTDSASAEPKTKKRGQLTTQLAAFIGILENRL